MIGLMVADDSVANRRLVDDGGGRKESCRKEK